MSRNLAYVIMFPFFAIFMALLWTDNIKAALVFSGVYVPVGCILVYLVYYKGEDS